MARKGSLGNTALETRRSMGLVNEIHANISFCIKRSTHHSFNMNCPIHCLNNLEIQKLMFTVCICVLSAVLAQTDMHAPYLYVFMI